MSLYWSVTITESILQIMICTLMEEDQHEKETSGVSVSVISLNNAMVTKIPTKSKRLRKAPIARSKDFLW